MRNFQSLSIFFSSWHLLFVISLANETDDDAFEHQKQSEECWTGAEQEREKEEESNNTIVLEADQSLILNLEQLK